jgi:CheY-like chemotaxis protein
VSFAGRGGKERNRLAGYASQLEGGEKESANTAGGRQCSEPDAAIRLLEKRGYTVSVAANGREALAAFEKENFDAILMDVQIPEMDGFEATGKIREHEKNTGKHIPIIAMTAHALKGDEDRCIQAGMDGYVSKPIRTNELYAALEKTVKKEEGSDPGDEETVPTATMMRQSPERNDR